MAPLPPLAAGRLRRRDGRALGEVQVRHGRRPERRRRVRRRLRGDRQRVRDDVEAAVVGRGLDPYRQRQRGVEVAGEGQRQGGGAARHARNAGDGEAGNRREELEAGGGDAAPERGVVQLHVPRWRRSGRSRPAARCWTAPRARCSRRPTGCGGPSPPGSCPNRARGTRRCRRRFRSACRTRCAARWPRRPRCRREVRRRAAVRVRAGGVELQARRQVRGRGKRSRRCRRSPPESGTARWRRRG